MKPVSGSRPAKPGVRTAMTCPICHDPVLEQETFAANGTRNGHRLVCSKRGCPWQTRTA